jgi:hypothetical protein
LLAAEAIADCCRAFREAESTAFVRMMGFSNPIVTTRNGRPSERRTTFSGTPILRVTVRPKKNAKTDEQRTVAASQNFEPMRFMDKNKETNVRCIERYPRIIMSMSRDSAL